MLIKIIGFFHLLHCPCLIVYPFFYNSFISDILYINYFYFIMFLYTFIEGECPISYVCKLLIDKNYKAGTNITYYPEMVYFLENNNSYFTITTVLYLFSLLYVFLRINLSFYISFPNLLLYFLCIRFDYFCNKKRIVQEITKNIMLLHIFYSFLLII